MASPSPPGGARSAPSRAIVRATLLFALAHVIGVSGDDDFGHALGLIAVGAGTRLPVAWVLGWSVVRRGSIWAPIGLHATFNAVLLSSPTWPRSRAAAAAETVEAR